MHPFPWPIFMTISTSNRSLSSSPSPVQSWYLPVLQPSRHVNGLHHPLWPCHLRPSSGSPLSILSVGLRWGWARYGETANTLTYLVQVGCIIIKRRVKSPSIDGILGPRQISMYTNPSCRKPCEPLLGKLQEFDLHASEVPKSICNRNRSSSFPISMNYVSWFLRKKAKSICRRSCYNVW